MPEPNPHPTLSFALDVADKAIKLAAVLLGGIWTYWNYRKSRTYAQRVQLEVKGSVFRKDGVYLEVRTRLKNLGATRHPVEQLGSYCEIRGIYADLSEMTIDIRSVFDQENFIEPDESISDLLIFSIADDANDLIWLRIHLRVVSQGIQWQEDEIIRVQAADSISDANGG